MARPGARYRFKYDRVEFEGGREFPICFMVGADPDFSVKEIKDGQAKANYFNETWGSVTWRWR